MTRARLLRAAIVVVVLVALVLLARTVNWPEAWRAVRAASPGLLLLAAVINVVSMGLKGVRWWVFLRSIGVRSLGLAIRGSFAGQALNNILIANAGEAARVLMVARAAGVRSESVWATLALERLFEFVGFFIVLGAAVAFFDLPPALDHARPVAGIGLLAIVGLLVYLARHPGSEGTRVARDGTWLTRMRSYLQGFVATMTTVSTPRRFAGAFVVSMAVWITQIATYHLTAVAAGFAISLGGTIACLLAVNLGFFARATPGNVGVFQAVYALVAVAFGMDKDQAIGVALLIQIQQLIPVTVLGLFAAPGILTRGRESVNG